MTKLQARRKQIPTAGTPLQISSDYHAVTSCWLSNPSTNSDVVYFGGSDLSAGKKFTLGIGDRVLIGSVDLSAIYGDVRVNGDYVEVLFSI